MKRILSKTLLTIKATALIAVFTLTHQKSFAARPEICTKPVPNPKTIHELYSCKRLFLYMGDHKTYIALSKDYIKKHISEETEKITLESNKKKKTYNMSLSTIKGYVAAGRKNIDFDPAFIIRHQKNQTHIQENIIFNGVTKNFGRVAFSHSMSKAEVLKFLKYSQHDLVLFKAVLSSNKSSFFLVEMITDEEQYEHFIKEAKWNHMIFE